jgi:hypothetical protein
MVILLSVTALRLMAFSLKVAVPGNLRPAPLVLGG